MTDLIQDTLAKHAAVATGPGMDYRCSCEDHLPDFVYRYKEGHVAHQAEAVREALTSDEAVERIGEYLHADECPDDVETCACGSYDREARLAISALIGGRRPCSTGG